MGVSNRNDKITRYWLGKSYDDCLPYLPPVRLDISITTACNTACAYCWQQEKKGSLLTFENVASVIDAICFLKPPKLNLTGGEPTTWPDFEQLLAHAKKAGINNILLCTNGYRLQLLEFAEKIVNLGVTTINISVDTFNPDKFMLLRGYKFSEFKNVLSNCIKLKKKFSNINITLVSVMSKAVTPEELFEIKKFCWDNNLGYFMQTFDNTEHMEVNKRFVLTLQEREIYKQRLTWLEGRVGKVVKRGQNPLTEGSSRVRCYKGITTVKLLSDGSISFCWKCEPIGNILEKTFIDIWLSKEAQEIREYIRDKKCDCDFDCDIFESLQLYDSI